MASPFEKTDAEAEEDGGGFDFAALADGDSGQDDEGGDEEANQFFGVDDTSEDTDGGFVGLVTDESESEDGVGADDSDLADFLNDLQ